MISQEEKQSKIQELTDLLGQREKAVQKQGIDVGLSEYEQDLINAPYKDWALICTMLQGADIDEEVYSDFLEYPSHYKIEDLEIVFNDNWEAEAEEKEKTRIGNLFLTAADVERAIYKVKEIDFDDIIAMCEKQKGVDVKALKIELKANNFYRGNPYVNTIGTMLGFSSSQLDEFFETGDYTALE